MAEVVPDTDAQLLHHFLPKSPWDARAVMDQVARDVGQPLALLERPVAQPSEQRALRRDVQHLGGGYELFAVLPPEDGDGGQGLGSREV